MSKNSDSQAKITDESEKNAEISERIQKIFREKDGTVPELCEELGWDRYAYGSLVSKGTRPPAWVLTRMVELWEVGPNWLLTGKGEMFGENGRVLDTPGDFLFFPRYNVEGSAGPGAEIVNEDVLDHLAFKTEWIKSDLKGSSRDFFLIHVRGESMEPTLRDGDLIMVDRRDNSFMFDAIYVFRSQGSILVKRIQILPNGEVAVISDNPAYETLRINPATTYDDFEVIGRVVWYSRQF